MAQVMDLLREEEVVDVIPSGAAPVELMAHAVLPEWAKDALYIAPSSGTSSPPRTHRARSPNRGARKAVTPPRAAVKAG